MVRFLVFSDLHLHNWNNIPIAHQMGKLWDVFCYAKEEGIKYILFCGDAFHTHGRIYTEALWIWNEFLGNLKNNDIKIFGISGNHDHADSQGSITPLESLDLVGAFLDGGKIADLGGIPIVGFTYSDRTDKVESYLENLPNECILLLHQGVNGVEVNSKGFTLNEALHASSIPDSVIHCFSGHYHSHKVVSNNLTIPGALFQHNWGDANEKRGFLDCLVDSQGTHIKHVEYPGPTEFVNLEYEDLNREWPHPINLKIKNAPADYNIDQFERVYGKYINNVIIEHESVQETKPETIRSDNFSVEDFFDEYVESRNVPEKNLEIGRQLIGK